MNLSPPRVHWIVSVVYLKISVKGFPIMVINRYPDGQRILIVCKLKSSGKTKGLRRGPFHVQWEPLHRICV